MMIMNLTCPECGNKFEIEESHQAKEKQAAALKEQREKAEKVTASSGTIERSVTYER